MRIEMETNKKVMYLENYCNLIRGKMLDMYATFGFGCVSGAFSMVELYAALYLNCLDIDAIIKNSPRRTRILPKGTSALAFYSILSAAGIMEEDRLKDYGSDLLPPSYHNDVVGVDATLYTMGPILGHAVGLALASKLKKNQYQTICFLGDAELQEGIDQAAKIAYSFGLDNLTVVIDCNEMQSFYRTEQGDHTIVRDKKGTMKRQKAFWNACGWVVKEIDGHNIKQILDAYKMIGKTKNPYLILAKTIKGKGIPGIEGKLGYQHRVNKEILGHARREFNEKVKLLDASEYCFKNNKPSKKNISQHHFVVPSGFTVKDFTINYSSDNLTPILTKWIYKIIEKNPGKVFLMNADCPKIFGEEAVKNIFSKENPDAVNIFPGLNERLMFAIAKSLAYEGLYPIITSPATHVMDCTEEWNAICKDKLPVLFIGNKPGATFSDWGPTHCAFEDITVFSKVNGKVFEPSNRKDLIWILNNIYSSPEKFLPAYLRINDFNIITEMTAELIEESWENGFYVVEGGEYTSDYYSIIATGSLMKESLDIKSACSGIKIKIINLFNLTEINGEKLRLTLTGSKRIVSLIEAKSNSISELLFTSMTPQQKAVYEPMGINSGLYVESTDIIKGDFYRAREYVLKKKKLDVYGISEKLFSQYSR
jgi:transketolase